LVTNGTTVTSKQAATQTVNILAIFRPFILPLLNKIIISFFNRLILRRQ
jgi:hypothetical protein